VHVQLAVCEVGAPAWDTQQMLEIVRVEIAPRTLVLEQTERAGALWVDACDPNRLVLRVPPQLREMPLDDVPAQLKPRVAALALAELAAGARIESPAPEPTPEPPTEAARAPVPPPARSQQVRVVQETARSPGRVTHTETWLGLGPEGRVFFYEPGPSFGPRLTLALRHLEVGIVALLGRQAAAAGDVSTGVVAGAVDVPFWWAKHAPDLSVAAGGELGVTWASAQLRDAQGDQARGTHALFASGLLRLSWGGRVARSAYAQVAWALGYARGLNARAQERIAASTHGPFMAMTATIAWAP
jgi:hypothetical protein